MVNAYFVDSSALAKRYVAETGTSWIQSIVHSSAHNQVIIARLTWVEVLSAFARRQREGSLSTQQVNKAIGAFRYDLDTTYQIIEMTPALVEQAGQLVSRHPLRAYDAVQLAAALHIYPPFAAARHTSLTFVAADDRLLSIAQAEGLSVENPNHHP